MPVIGTSNKIQGRNTLEKGLQSAVLFYMQTQGEYGIMTNLTKYETEMVVNYNVGEQMATVYMRNKFVIRNGLNPTFWVLLLF